MIKALDEYKEDNDIYLKFVNENYITKSKDNYESLTKLDKPKWRILKSVVYDNFIMWLKVKNDAENRKITKKDFYNSMKNKMVEIKVSSEYYVCQEIETIEQEKQKFDSVISTTDGI